jgi:hypothetical protein
VLTTAFTGAGLQAEGVVVNPRWFVKLATSVDGEDIDTGIQPKHFSHHRGSHNKADEVRVDLDLTAFDFPIRLIAGAFLTLYYGLTERADGDIATKENIRFMGVVVDYSNDYHANSTSVEAQDLTYLCRRKSYPVRKTQVLDSDDNVIAEVNPTPYYRDSLKTNIKRLLSMLPEFCKPGEQPPLQIRDTPALANANLAKLVGPRAQKTPIPLHPDCTVWEAIEHLCGLVGCHVGLELNEIVVRSSEEVFAGRTSRCTLIYGGANGNAFGPKFHKKPLANRNGVRVIAMDPETHKLKSAIYPSETELRAIKAKQPKHPKQVKAAPKKASTKPKRPPDALPRDVQELDPGQYTQEALEERAKAIWLERSRQECDGSVATPIWTEEILALKNADLITVRVNADLADQIQALGDDTAASFLLQDVLGYDRAAANALVRAARKPYQDLWYVKEVTFEAPGDHLVTIHFINLVEV